MPCAPEALAAAFSRQASHCAALGSSLWAEAATLIAEDILRAGAFFRILEDWEGDPAQDNLPLRLLGGLHYVALAGLAPDLAARLPSTGGGPGMDLAPALLAAIAAKPDEIRGALAHPPQTNEAGRSAVLLGGFLEVAALSSLPLRLLELGASAGLNLCWDRYAYRLGAFGWQQDREGLTLQADWRGPPPRLDALVAVASRAACDRRPIDLADPEARLRLQGYVWPDQVERLAALRGAMAIAREMGVHVERADAVDWTGHRLARRTTGEATVVYHSVVLQYLDRPARQRFVELLEALGRQATKDRPLAWLAFELNSGSEIFELSLTYWPGGEQRRLAVAQAHGRWVEWLS